MTLVSWASALIVGFVAGAAISRLLLAELLTAAVFRRRNYRHADLATAGGLAIILVVLAAAAAATLIDSIDDDVVGDVPAWSRTSVVIAICGFGLLGLLDDLGGDRSSRGFAGHLGALRRGRPTTGTVKLFGGATVGLVAVGSMPGSDSIGGVLVGGAVVALAANAANLFDLAPARTTKVAVLVGVAVVAGSAAGDHVGAEGAVLVVLGAALALARHELSETLMLGDTGANAIGAAVGVLVVGAYGPAGELLALATLVVVNAAAEVVSFSRIIDSVPPLRWLDRWGRRS